MKIDFNDVNIPVVIKDSKGTIVFDNGILTKNGLRFVFELNGLRVYFGDSNHDHRRIARFHLDDIIGSSEMIANVKRLVLICAKSDSPVIITGESGTGKELAAQAIHHESSRKKSPFIAVNCGSIPGELVESELFGYAPNSFTGASSKGYIGKFRSAKGGTIFLDEIGDMPHSTQVKLLRVLQDGIVHPLGSTEQIKVDAKILAATNKDLKQLIKMGIFREDLYYRLSVLSVQMPSLHERPEDIPLLVKYFESKFRGKNPSYDKTTFSEKNLLKLKKYRWPGNVRELQNYVDRELWINNDKKRVISHIPDHILNSINTEETASGAGMLEKNEILFLAQCLDQASGNISIAARIAGISRSTYYRKIKKYGLSAS